MNGQGVNFGPLLGKSYKSRKIQKIGNPAGSFFFSVLVLRKNNKLAIQQ